MSIISIAVHFDGRRIVLDEPVELAPNAKLIITVLPTLQADDHAEWMALSQHGLTNAYADDEIEYTLDGG